jgi:hypothetical protein
MGAKMLIGTEDIQKFVGVVKAQDAAREALDNADPFGRAWDGLYANWIAACARAESMRPLGDEIRRQCAGRLREALAA